MTGAKKGSKKSYLLVEKPTAKGQIISEAIFLVVKSSKKQTKCLLNVALATRNEVFCSFFGRIENEKRNNLRFTDL